VLSGSSQFFLPPGGGANIGVGAGAGQDNELAEVTFNLSLDVTPQVTALGNVIMQLQINSDTPGEASGQALANKNQRSLKTQMVRQTGETGVIGGIYDTKRTSRTVGIPFLSDLPIIGALFRSSSSEEKQTELLIMVTPTILSGPKGKDDSVSEQTPAAQPVISKAPAGKKGRL
jgi:type IV pilus assembly protein PilQ